MNPALAYHEYLGPAMFAPCAALTLEAARIEPHERVLDVACGTGIVTSRVRAARVVGLDVSPHMLEIARRTAPDVEWVCASGQAMEFPDRSFDVVLCQHGLQFFPDREAGARELRRVCAKRAVVTCWAPLEQQTFMADLVRAQAHHLGVSVEEASTPFSMPELGPLLRDAGFVWIEVDIHTFVARFPDPPAFLRLMSTAALAVMPAQYRTMDPAAFAAAVASDVQQAMERYVVADHLEVPMTTAVARAFV